MRSHTNPARRRRSGIHLTVAAILITVLVAVLPVESSAESFRKKLARVDKALQTNPNHVANRALYTCQDRRDRAAQLFEMGQQPRAERSLVFCFSLLGIPREAPEGDDESVLASAAKRAAEAARKTRAAAQREFDQALVLTPNLENGLEIYRGCAACHGPEGWGLSNAVIPQLAGQHRKVVIRQLADIRAGNRENRVMVPYSSPERIGGAQAVADVAGYIDSLEIDVENGKGEGDDLALGERLYQERCQRCHDARGEGDDEAGVPRIQSQHYIYLVTQFELIREGKRLNVGEEKVEVVKALDERETHAVMDYVSRLTPPDALRAPPGWRNPDFAAPQPGS